MRKSSSDSTDKAQDMFARTIDLLGEEGFRALEEARVLVVGLGGVGSHAAVALARVGVGKLRLVDFDDVTWSSLNRHACAVRSDVGKPKVDVLRRFLSEVNPALDIDTQKVFFHDDTADAVFSGSWDLVLDAIDSVTPKIALLRQCVERRLPVVSSMGASARTNPTLLRVGDINETRVCPLARVIRRGLRQHGIRSGIRAVYSIEAPLSPLPPEECEETLKRGRVRSRLPSLSALPGIFGYAVAAVAIGELSGRKLGSAR